MKRVKYSIVRYSKKGYFRFSGYGQIDEENLYTRYKDQNGNQIEKTYEDCLRYLHKCGKNELKGNYSEFQEVTFENEKGYLTDLEIEVEYSIWLRILN